jgi:hypothetical protein
VHDQCRYASSVALVLEWQAIRARSGRLQEDAIHV